MRCRACNAMMELSYTRRGDIEDLCIRCRRSIYSSMMEEYWTNPESPSKLNPDEVGVPLQQDEEEFTYDRPYEDETDGRD